MQINFPCGLPYNFFFYFDQNTYIFFTFFQENTSNADKFPMWFPYHVRFISKTMALHSACCRVALAEAIVGVPCNSLYNVCHILDWPKAAARIKPITKWYNMCDIVCHTGWKHWSPQKAPVTVKWKCCHFDDIFITGWTESCQMTTFSEANYENVIKIIEFPFQCMCVWYNISQEI